LHFAKTENIWFKSAPKARMVLKQSMNFGWNYHEAKAVVKIMLDTVWKPNFWSSQKTKSP